MRFLFDTGKLILLAKSKFNRILYQKSLAYIYAKFSVIPPLAVLLITTGLYWPLLAQSPALSSSAETGLPLIRNYSPREYRAAPDVWAIVQDPRGGMYFGCGNGVLEYDGVSWRLIRMSSGSTCMFSQKEMTVASTPAGKAISDF
jgi:hypothetical protein